MRASTYTRVLVPLFVGALSAPILLGQVAAEDAANVAVMPAAEPTATPSRSEAEAGTAEALRKVEDELAPVMDEMVTARARAGVLAQALFRTALEVELVRLADEVQLEHVTLRLDGVPVHDGDGSVLRLDRAKLFEGYVAPGMHELAIELSERAKAGGEFGYVRSERYRIDVKAKRRTQVELIVRDDSDMAEEAKQGDDGEYDVATELRVRYGRASR